MSNNNDSFPFAAAAAALRHQTTSPAPPAPIATSAQTHFNNHDHNHAPHTHAHPTFHSSVPSRPPSRTASLRNMTQSPALRHHHRRNSSTGLTQAYQSSQDQPAFSNKFQSFQPANGPSRPLSRSSSRSGSLRLHKGKPAHRHRHLSLSRSSTIHENGPGVIPTASTITSSAAPNAANPPRIAWDHQSQTLVMIRPDPVTPAVAQTSGPSRHARSHSDNPACIADLGIGMADADLLRRNRIERRASLPHYNHHDYKKEVATNPKIVEPNDANDYDDHHHNHHHHHHHHHNQALLKRQPINNNNASTPSPHPHPPRPHRQKDHKSSHNHHHASHPADANANANATATATDATSHSKNVSHRNLVQNRVTDPARTPDAGKHITVIDDDLGQVSPVEKVKRRDDGKEGKKKKKKKKREVELREMGKEVEAEKRREDQEKAFQKKGELNSSDNVNVDDNTPKADRKVKNRAVNFDATASVPREIGMSAGKSVADSVANAPSSPQLKARKKVEGRKQKEGHEEENVNDLKNQRKPHPEEPCHTGPNATTTTTATIPAQPTTPAVLPSGDSGCSFVNDEKTNQVDLQSGTVAIPTPSSSTSSVIVKKSQNASDRDVDGDDDEESEPEIHTSEHADALDTATQQPESDGSQPLELEQNRDDAPESSPTDKPASTTSTSPSATATATATATASPSPWGVSYWLTGWNVNWLLPSWSHAKNESPAEKKDNRDGAAAGDLGSTASVEEDDGKSIYMDAHEQWTNDDEDDDDDDGGDDSERTTDAMLTGKVDEKDGQLLPQSPPSAVTPVESARTSPSDSDVRKSEKVRKQGRSEDDQQDSSSRPSDKTSRRKHRLKARITTVPDAQEKSLVPDDDNVPTVAINDPTGKENQKFATTKDDGADAPKRSRQKSSKGQSSIPAPTSEKPKNRRGDAFGVQAEAQPDLNAPAPRSHKRTKPKRRQGTEDPHLPPHFPDATSQPKSIHVPKTRKPYRNDVAKSDDVENEMSSLPRTNVFIPAPSSTTAETRSPVGTMSSGVGRRNSCLSSDGSSTYHPVTDLYSLGNGSASSFKRKPTRRGSKRASVFSSLRMGRSPSIRSSSSAAAPLPQPAPPPPPLPPPSSSRLSSHAALTDQKNSRTEKSHRSPSPLLASRPSASPRPAQPTSPLVSPSRSASPLPPPSPRARPAFAGAFAPKPRRRFSVSSSDDDEGGGAGSAFLSSISQNIRSRRRWDDSSSDSSDDDGEGGRRRMGMGMSMRKDEPGKKHGLLQKIGLDKSGQKGDQQPLPLPLPQPQQPQQQPPSQERQEQQEQQHLAVPELTRSSSGRWSSRKSSKGDKPARKSIFSIFSKSSKTAPSKPPAPSSPTPPSPAPASPSPSSIPAAASHRSSGANETESQRSAKSNGSPTSPRVGFASSASPRNSAQYQQQQQPPLNIPPYPASPRRLSGVSNLSPVAEGSPAQSSGAATPANPNAPSHDYHDGSHRRRQSAHSATLPGENEAHASGKKSRLPLRGLLTRSNSKSSVTRLPSGASEEWAGAGGEVVQQGDGKKVRRHRSFLGRKR